MTTPRTSTTRAFSGLAIAVMLTALVAGAAPAAAATSRAPAAEQVAGTPGGSPRAAVPVRGTITAVPDLGTLTVTPSPGGERCRFRLESTLELDGSVAGTATGVTEATIHAPCAEATSNPPGTFADTFAFRGDFAGTVAGDAATAEVTYAGLTRAGGEVSALLVLQGEATAVAAVRAGLDPAGVFAGTYRGIGWRGAGH
jgi:hypothetical protein